jgi:hypothetical protein
MVNGTTLAEMQCLVIVKNHHRRREGASIGCYSEDPCNLGTLFLVILELFLKLLLESQVRLILLDLFQYILEYPARLFLFRLVRMTFTGGKNLVVFVVLSATFMVGIPFCARESHLDKLARHVHSYKVFLFSKVFELGS